jgi:hypothetical protein
LCKLAVKLTFPVANLPLAQAVASRTNKRPCVRAAGTTSELKKRRILMPLLEVSSSSDDDGDTTAAAAAAASQVDVVVDSTRSLVEGAAAAAAAAARQRSLEDDDDEHAALATTAANGVGWTCGTCTLDNAATYLQCGACQALRPASFSSPSVSTMEEKAASALFVSPGFGARHYCQQQLRQQVLMTPSLPPPPPPPAQSYSGFGENVHCQREEVGQEAGGGANALIGFGDLVHQWVEAGDFGAGMQRAKAYVLSRSLPADAAEPAINVELRWDDRWETGSV